MLAEANLHVTDTNGLAKKFSTVDANINSLSRELSRRHNINVTRFVKRGLPHTFNLPTLTLMLLI